MNIMDVLLLAQEIQASDGISELTSMYFLLSRNIAFHPYAVLDVFSKFLNEPIEELLNSHEKQQYLLEDISEPQCDRTKSQYIEMIMRDTSMEPVFPKGSRLKIDTSEITDEGLVAIKLIGSEFIIVAFSYKDLQRNEYVLKFPNPDYMSMYFRLDEDADKLQFIVLFVFATLM